MKQYLKLLQAIQEEGTDKPAARANMPGTRSLFGYQFRHDLADGFPLLTTKKMFWKGVVVELLWFLRGDTNIKFLIDNGCNIWNEDAYQYYRKIYQGDGPMPFADFVNRIKAIPSSIFDSERGTADYQLGDCGEQYGKLWRFWKGSETVYNTAENAVFKQFDITKNVDQIADLIKGLKNSPESRRHILTAWNPATLDQMALNACHVLVQFNCRPIQYFEGDSISYGKEGKFYRWVTKPKNDGGYKFESVEANSIDHILEDDSFPAYYIDCQLYQRSADSVLGVPFNIASYALLTHIVAKMVNMVPGDFIHTFGDAHIYDNHKEAVAEQLSRTPTQLPVLHLNENIDWVQLGESLDFESLYHTDFVIGDYHPQPSIKAELKTGL